MSSISNILSFTFALSEPTTTTTRPNLQRPSYHRLYGPEQTDILNLERSSLRRYGPAPNDISESRQFLPPLPYSVLAYTMSDPAKPTRSERLAVIDAQITARIQARKNVPLPPGHSQTQQTTTRIHTSGTRPPSPNPRSNVNVLVPAGFLTYQSRSTIDLAFCAAYKMPPITRYARTPLVEPAPIRPLSEIEITRNVLREDDPLGWTTGEAVGGDLGVPPSPDIEEEKEI